VGNAHRQGVAAHEDASVRGGLIGGFAQRQPGRLSKARPRLPKPAPARRQAGARVDSPLAGC
jgi:hypothetical protein